MCGIVGSSGREPELVARMADAIAHRGPDGAGVHASDDGLVTLGHRRLAILDLHPRGAQPMRYAHGGRELWGVFNGEIYNFRALRSELQALGFAFATHTDTEVLLAAQLAWGSGALARMHGMWAFALWDGAQRTLTLARDRFGKKPLYYASVGARLSFASEIKALLVDPALPRRADLAACADYVYRGLSGHTHGSFFAGVRQVPAGHFANFDPVRAQLVVEPYYLPSKGAPASDLRSTLRAAVERRTVADVPIALSLSGGVDSASLAALLAELLPEGLAAFTTVSHDGAGDERSNVSQVLQRYPRYQLHAAELSHDAFVRDHAALVAHAEEPLWGDAQYVRWTIAREVRAQGLRVLITGEGADELLGGYFPASAFQLRTLLAEGRYGALLRELWGALALSPDRARIVGALALLVMGDERAAFWRHDQRARALELRLGEPSTSLVAPIADGSLQDCLVHMLTVYPLPQLLACNDRMSMAHGVESRAPFLDHELAAACLAYAPEELCRAGRRKAPLRAAMARDLPRAIVARRKKDAFASPMARYMRGSAMSAERTRVFAEPRVAKIVDVRRLRARAQDPAFGTLLERLFWLETWARTFDVEFA